MTTLNTLFLPLLGGFLFYYISHWTSYFAANQPAQSVLYFSAFSGLVLLIIAGLVSYYCGKLPTDHTDAKLLLGLLVLPPVLLAQMLGYLSAVLQSRLQNSRIGRRKAFLALSSSLIAVVVIVNLVVASGSFPCPFGIPPYAYWIVGVALILLWAVPWAKISSMPLSSVLVRSTALTIAMMLLLHWLLPRLSDLLNLWTGVTKPIGDGKAIEGIGTAFLACILGPTFALCFNVIYSKEAAAARLVRRGWATGLEQLIYSAARRKQFVMMTMDDRKVYVGIAAAIFGNPRSRDAYIRILPLMSGYRDDKTHQVRFTTFYRKAFKAAGVQSPAAQLQFEKVLPIERVASAGLFSPRYYRSFQDEQPSGDSKSVDLDIVDQLKQIAKNIDRLGAQQAAHERRHIQATRSPRTWREKWLARNKFAR